LVIWTIEGQDGSGEADATPRTGKGSIAMTTPEEHPTPVRPSFDLTGRVGIVTGGSKGLGRAIALGFAAAGATIVVASRKAELCRRVVDEIAALGGRALAVATHLGRLEEVDRLVAAAMDEYGRLDILVNNAATNPLVGPLELVDKALFDKVFSVNVLGPLHLSVAAAAVMAGQGGGGSIINVVSRAAARPERDLGVYASSKAALVCLTQTMALEWASRGIRVNGIAPGPFATVMVDELFRQEEYREQLIGATAQRRVAEPWEIVGAALYLASDASSFTTGAILNVDGGMVP
jgi:NAD(P)-dependent dehydrogenase (short-subunit alcohol dehydrogenase family)